jgi:hypothetical protein
MPSGEQTTSVDETALTRPGENGLSFPFGRVVAILDRCLAARLLHDSRRFPPSRPFQVRLQRQTSQAVLVSPHNPARSARR